MFFEKLNKGIVICSLCNHNCRIGKGKRGICGVRENINGDLYSLVYGKVISQAIDPIEKKPLYHFLPGSKTYSIATVGCNFSCLNCQNSDISQIPKKEKNVIGEEINPKEIVKAAKHYKCKSIAYTYTEPTIFFEYALEVAKLAKKEGIKNIFVTNGYISEEALQTIAPFLDASNIDLKSYDDLFYRKICGARLEPVLKTIKNHKEMNIWFEITTLVIPTLNDKPNNFSNIAKFIKNLDNEIPWHITSFFPTYRLPYLSSTSLNTLVNAQRIGKKCGLKHVYLGNVPEKKIETYCSSCGNVLIRRNTYAIDQYIIEHSKCPYCNKKLKGIFTLAK